MRGEVDHCFFFSGIHVVAYILEAPGLTHDISIINVQRSTLTSDGVSDFKS